VCGGVGGAQWEALNPKARHVEQFFAAPDGKGRKKAHKISA